MTAAAARSGGEEEEEEGEGATISREMKLILQRAS